MDARTVTTQQIGNQAIQNTIDNFIDDQRTLKPKERVIQIEATQEVTYQTQIDTRVNFHSHSTFSIRWKWITFFFVLIFSIITFTLEGISLYRITYLQDIDSIRIQDPFIGIYLEFKYSQYLLLKLLYQNLFILLKNLNYKLNYLLKLLPQQFHSSFQHHQLHGHSIELQGLANNKFVLKIDLNYMISFIEIQQFSYPNIVVLFTHHISLNGLLFSHALKIEQTPIVYSLSPELLQKQQIQKLNINALVYALEDQSNQTIKIPL